MTIAFASEEVINKPCSDVWRILTDWENASKWMNGIDELRAHGETSVGTELTFVARGKERSSNIEVCENESLIVLKSTQGSVTALYRYELSPVDENSTKVRLVADCESSGFLFKLLFPILKIAMRKFDGSQIANLKQLIESE